MTFFTGIILYMMLYWLIIFMVLPWGNQASENPEVGNATSAPANPRLKQKFLVTAVLAAVVWGIVFALIQLDVIDFYAIASQMSQEDLQQ